MRFAAKHTKTTRETVRSYWLPDICWFALHSDFWSTPCSRSAVDTRLNFVRRHYSASSSNYARSPISSCTFFAENTQKFEEEPSAFQQDVKAIDPKLLSTAVTSPKVIVSEGLNGYYYYLKLTSKLDSVNRAAFGSKVSCYLLCSQRYDKTIISKEVYPIRSSSLPFVSRGLVLAVRRRYVKGSSKSAINISPLQHGKHLVPPATSPDSTASTVCEPV